MGQPDISDVHQPGQLGVLKVPFGPYKDFKDCVSKNQDKDNPAAFCATVHKKATGKWPTEASEQVLEEAQKFDEETEQVRMGLRGRFLSPRLLYEMFLKSRGEFRRLVVSISRETGLGTDLTQEIIEELLEEQKYLVRPGVVKPEAALIHPRRKLDGPPFPASISNGQRQLEEQVQEFQGGGSGLDTYIMGLIQQVLGAVKDRNLGRATAIQELRDLKYQTVDPKTREKVDEAIDKINREWPTMSEFQQNLLQGVEVFKAGIHTDSVGQTHKWTKEELQKVLNAFGKGVPPSVPVKLGHTSDEFNQQVAEALGVPIEVLKGEGERGLGQARLGEVVALHLNGALTADVKLANEKVSDLIKGGYFNGVSVEIQSSREQEGKTWGPVLSALALLGGQRPSLSTLQPLQQATLLEDGTQADQLFLSEFQTVESTGNVPTEGSMRVPASEVSEGDPEKQKTWDVPMRDPFRNRTVTATVSAPDAVTAKRVGLRAVENFLLSAGGPLGAILGGALGAVMASRMVLGKPILSTGLKGLLRWRFEEEQEFQSFDNLLQGISRLIGLLGHKEDMTPGGEKVVLASLKDLLKEVEQRAEEIVRAPVKQGEHAEPPVGVEQSSWNACLRDARAKGIDSPESHCRTKFRNQMEEAMKKQLAEILSLSEDAEEEEFLEAVRKLKEGDGQLSANAEFQELDKEVKGLRHQVRIAHFVEETQPLTAIAGTPKELAEKLVTFEEQGGEDLAKSILSEWQGVQKLAEDKGLLTALLSSGEGAPGGFMDEVHKYQGEHPDITLRDAITTVAKAEPTLYEEYNVAVRDGKR